MKSKKKVKYIQRNKSKRRKLKSSNKKGKSRDNNNKRKRKTKSRKKKMYGGTPGVGSALPCETVGNNGKLVFSGSSIAPNALQRCKTHQH